MKKFIIAIMSAFLFVNIANAIELKGVWIAFNMNEDNELWFYDHNNKLKGIVPDEKTLIELVDKGYTFFCSNEYIKFKMKRGDNPRSFIKIFQIADNCSYNEEENLYYLYDYKTKETVCYPGIIN